MKDSFKKKEDELLFYMPIKYNYSDANNIKFFGITLKKLISFIFLNEMYRKKIVKNRKEINYNDSYLLDFINNKFSKSKKINALISNLEKENFTISNLNRIKEMLFFEYLITTLFSDFIDFLSINSNEVSF